MDGMVDALSCAVNNSGNKRDIIAITDFSRELILHILKLAKDLEENPQPNLLSGKILATLFFEPSTRTRLSFETAMHRLGGRVIGFSDDKSTSVKKGETLYDTIRMVEGYADVIAMRHPLEGSALFASEVASIPVVNGGDGANQHPTQTFLDLYTIQKALGRLTNLKIGFVGDLKYGRTVHSLVRAMSNFFPEMTFISLPELALPVSYIEDLNSRGIKFKIVEDLRSIISELDVLYVTRIQKERFPDIMEYEKVKGKYRLDSKMIKNAKESLIVLHPLPRVDEIDQSFDCEKGALYFTQAHNAVPVRQALLGWVLGVLK